MSISSSRTNDFAIMQDESNPDFVAEVVELYFEDSAGKLDKLEGKLAATTPDFNDIDQLVHQFKGSSASFGAQKLAALCVQVKISAWGFPGEVALRGRATHGCLRACAVPGYWWS